MSVGRREAEHPRRPRKGHPELRPLDRPHPRRGWDLGHGCALGEEPADDGPQLRLVVDDLLGRGPALQGQAGQTIKAAFNVQVVANGSGQPIPNVTLLMINPQDATLAPAAKCAGSPLSTYWRDCSVSRKMSSSRLEVALSSA